MPKLSKFYGIVVAMFFKDHNPPHVHVFPDGQGRNPEWTVQLRIRDGAIMEGEIPSWALKLVRDWMRLRQPELNDAWDRAVRGLEPRKIDPPEMV
jgi:hypothetical protein